MSQHDYITVGRRRWCLGCNTFQRFKAGRWCDDETLLGPWPGYSRTQPYCIPTEANDRPVREGTYAATHQPSRPNSETRQ